MPRLIIDLGRHPPKYQAPAANKFEQPSLSLRGSATGHLEIGAG
jgi:hypothetical protein